MNLVVCPHCKSHRIVTAKVPKDVVVVMPCPSCGELVVVFRKKVIALNRDILESGTMDERKDHLATIIAQFLEPGMFSKSRGEDRDEPRRRKPGKNAAADSTHDPDWKPPISEKELEEFTRIHLEQLDNAEYFKKHFG